MKAYKVFDKNWRCRDFKFEVGETYEIDGEPILCRKGFHSCKRLVDCFNYYDFDPKNKVAEVELIGKIIGLNEDKQVTNKIKIIRELKWIEVLNLCNSGDSNSGHSNSGNSNSGHSNSGYRNSGDWNSGNRNSGYRNSGDSNSGDWNSGDSNSGHSNSGNSNSGHSNSGYSNSGDSNSGNRNSGYRNSGDSNSGDSNSGNSNSGHSNSGYRNSGDSNSGYRNSGDSNSGHSNSGNSNSGHSNSGYRNSGHSNSGDSNSGDSNSGDWNSGDWNSGDWNSKTPEKIYFFNKLIVFDELITIRNSNAYNILNNFCMKRYRIRTVTGKYGDFKYLPFKSSFKLFWRNLKVKERLEIIKMPYFDKNVFYEITGIKLK